MENKKKSRLEDWNLYEQICRNKYYQSAQANLQLPPDAEALAMSLFGKCPSQEDLRHFTESRFFLDGDSIALVKHPRYLNLDYHSHDFYELVYVYQGGCENILSKTALEMISGDLCIMPPNQAHKILCFRDDGIVVNILIRKSTFRQSFQPLLSEFGLLSDFFSHTLFQKENSAYLFFRCGDDDIIRQQVRAMYEEYEDPGSFSSCILTSQLMLFLGTLMRLHQHDVLQFYSKTPQSAIPITSLLQYISDHCRTVTLQDVAQQFNYSRSRCSNIIREATGKSFTVIIREAKVQLAAQLLLSDSYTMTQIAEESGFFDASHLYRAFSSVYGISPAQYRQAHRVGGQTSRPEPSDTHKEIP